jgi:hypothetical protein
MKKPGASGGRATASSQSVSLVLTLSDDIVKAIDLWIAAQPEPRPRRSEAARYLILSGIGATLPKKSE